MKNLLSVIFCLVVLVLNSKSKAEEEYENPHQGRTIKGSFEDLTVSLGFRATVATVANGARTPGGSEFDFGHTIFNPKFDITRKLQCGLLGLTFDYVPEENLADISKNRLRAPGYLVRPSSIFGLYFQRSDEGNFFRLGAGQDFYAGFEPIAGYPTDYYGSVASPLILSWKWGQGVSFDFRRLSSDSKTEVFRIKGSIIDGDDSVSTVRNSYPGYSIISDARIGGFKLCLSGLKNDTGSNPGSKRRENHALLGLGFNRMIFNQDFEVRYSLGVLQRGLTDKEETTGVKLFELAFRDVALLQDAGSFDLYCALWQMDLQSGEPSGEIWKGRSDFEKGLQIGATWKEPFKVPGLQAFLSVTFRDIEGFRSWGILEEGDQYVYVFGLRYSL